MKISKFIKRQILLIFSCIFLASAFWSASKNPRPGIIISKQDSSLNLTSNMTQYFHLGQKRLISSAIWIATILESDLDHYKQKDMNSWMFLRFKTISDLEPRFYENYYMGGVYLSIVKDDLLGASYMYDKGLYEYPNDYFLLKNAAFHYEFEVGDQKKSFEIYKKLKIHPQTDSTTIGIAARLETQFGDKNAALELLKEQYAKMPDKNSFLALVLYQNLYALRAEIDLDCLNSKEISCSLKDLDGNRYMFDGQTYSAQKSWTLFRLRHRKK